MSDEETDRRRENEGEADLETPAEHERGAAPPLQPPASIPPPPDDPRIGQVLVGRYRIERLIGKGGMGRVYLGIQHPLNRQVAVKILSPEFQAKDPQFVRRFFLEAATAARLNHPNSITIFDYGETERGELFIAMEYLRGRSLSRVIAADGLMPAQRVLHIAMQIARALREAHAKGIIHRDLKPGNIMLLDEAEDPDVAKVLDFGLVKLFTPEDSGGRAVMEQLTPSPLDAELTHAGMFLGSPKYMSPEQIQNHDLDPRTDVYSLGVIMYQMVAGRVPFRGDSSVEIIYKHVHAPVPPIHDLNPEADAPPELEEIIRRCLAKKREDRFLGMAELLIALKEAARSLAGGVSNSSSFDVMNNELRAFASGEVASSLPPGGLTTGEVRPSAIPFLDRDAERDDTPGSHPLVDVRYTRRRWGRPGARWGHLLPYALAGGLVLALGVVAYQLSSWRSERAAPEDRLSTEPSLPPLGESPLLAEPLPLPDPEPELTPTTTVVFESYPPGAEVHEAGERLGLTPFETALLRGADAPRVFVFKKPGHQDESIEQRVEGDRLKIVARLRETPPPEIEADESTQRPPPKRPKKPPRERVKRPVPDDFKENPY